MPVWTETVLLGPPPIPDDGLLFAGERLEPNTPKTSIRTEAAWLPGEKYAGTPVRGETFALWIEDDKFARHELIINIAHWIKKVFSLELPGLIDESVAFTNSDQNNARSEVFPKYIFNTLLESYAYDMRIDGDFEGGDFLTNAASLNRHLHTDGQLLQLVAERISSSAHFDNNVEAKKFCSEHNVHYAYVIGASHDFGRWVTQSSQHDEAGDLILELAGFVPEIKNAHHRPVPMTVDFDADEFDANPWQKLSRLTDVFSKVKDAEQFTLRTTLAEVVTYSRERQRIYWEHERVNPKSIWFNTSEQELEQYHVNEQKALESAVAWLKTCGVDWFDLIERVSLFDGNLDEYFNA